MHIEPSFSVKSCGYEDLPDKYKDIVPNNGQGKEYANYIIVYHNNEIVSVNSDAMEPEDAVFFRDLKWIEKSLNECYSFGKHDALDGM